MIGVDQCSATQHTEVALSGAHRITNDIRKTLQRGVGQWTTDTSRSCREDVHGMEAPMRNSRLSDQGRPVESERDSMACLIFAPEPSFLAATV